MREQLTIDRIANSIIQRRKKYENFILVEGTQDRLMLLKFKNNSTQIEITFGWEKLIDIIEALKKRGFSKAIGIIDKDLKDIIPEEKNFGDNVILTTEHDLNIMCIEKSFEVIFAGHCSQEKVDNFKADKKVDCLKTYTYNLSMPISFLKILNKRDNLNLSFKSKDVKKNRLDYSKFIDRNTYEFISLEKLVETISNFSRSRTNEKLLSDNIILGKLKTIIKNENYEGFRMVSGHDFGEIICLGLKKSLGTIELDSDTFLRENILNYDSRDFTQSKLFQKIKVCEHQQQTEYLKL